MKIIQKKENGLYDIEFFDKITTKKVKLEDVSDEVISLLKKSKSEEERYRKLAKKHLVSLDGLMEAEFEFVDEDEYPELQIMQQAEEDEKRRMRNEIYKAIRQLTLRQRQVIRMKIYEQKSNKEIAEALKLSEPRITQLDKQAMENIRKILKNHKNFC